MSSNSANNNVNLRNLIQTVRAAKTATEERSIIQRESATIRHVLGHGSPSVAQRARCVLKLAYMSMLGYSTEFAQMHVVTLMAEPDFAAKRVAYLAMAILLDERQEVLTLTENHIKRDLTSGNALTCCLALDAVANLAGEDMVHDVLQDIISLLDSNSAAVRRKACLVSLRIVRKVPGVAEALLEKLVHCTAERNHGVLLTALNALTECATLVPEKTVALMAGRSSSLVTLLKGLVLSAYATEYDVGAIADPFLQCQILRFFAALAAAQQQHPGSDNSNNNQALEAVNDILAQVATNTDGQRNVGCAVLYECVRTIAASHNSADDGLRVLGVNILGRFVLNKDNNIRYVALSTLKQWVAREPQAVQRHRMTIMECLKDADISLRRKALELTVALVSAENVRALVPDLLSYLAVCAPELKAECCSMLCDVVDRFAPTPEWRLMTSLRLLHVGGDTVPVPFAVRFVGLVTRLTDDLKTKAVQSLWCEFISPVAADAMMEQKQASSSSKDKGSVEGGNYLQRESAMLAATWVIGEYLSRLLKAGAGTDTTSSPTAAAGTVDIFGPAGGAAAASNNNSNNVDDFFSGFASNKAAAQPQQQAPAAASSSSGAAGTAAGGPTVVTPTAQNAFLAFSHLFHETDSHLLRQYILTAVTKMAARDGGNSNLRSTVRPLLEQAAQSLDCELQQRACEYMFLLTNNNGQLAEAAFEPMPQIPEAAAVGGAAISLAGVSGAGGASAAAAAGAKKTNFDDIFGGGAPSSGGTSAKNNNNNAVDIFGGGGSSNSLTTPVGAKPPGSGAMDIFGGGGASQPTKPAATSSPSTTTSSSSAAPINFTAFDNGDLTITLAVTPRAGNANTFEHVDVGANVRAKGSALGDVSLLVSVLRTMTVQLAPASATSVGAGSKTLVQNFSVDATQDPNKGATFQARVKVSYSVNGASKSEVFTANKDLKAELAGGAGGGDGLAGIF